MGKKPKRSIWFKIPAGLIAVGVLLVLEWYPSAPDVRPSLVFGVLSVAVGIWLLIRWW